MANRFEKHPDNVSGKYYTDIECIGCRLCSELAPENFHQSADGDHDVLYQQPQNQDQENRCKEAMESCPVEAIGDDGKKASNK